MAGSWSHMTTDEGQLLRVRQFHNNLDTGGDVYEAAQQCFGMIWYMARLLATVNYGTLTPSREQIMDFIARAEASYRYGLDDGGIQPGN